MVEAAYPVESGTSAACAGPLGAMATGWRQRVCPVLASRQKTSRFFASPPEKKTRSPQTIGELNPPAGTGTFHAMPAPVLASHVTGTLVIIETPLPSDPRKRAQFCLSSLSDAASPPWVWALEGPAACN